jgi:hypothetical protein
LLLRIFPRIRMILFPIGSRLPNCEAESSAGDSYVGMTRFSRRSDGALKGLRGKLPGETRENGHDGVISVLPQERPGNCFGRAASAM